MAVPKRKTSPSKRNMRRSHHSSKDINIILDKVLGETGMPSWGWSVPAERVVWNVMPAYVCSSYSPKI